MSFQGASGQFPVKYRLISLQFRKSIKLRGPAVNPSSPPEARGPPHNQISRFRRGPAIRFHQTLKPEPPPLFNSLVFWHSARIRPQNPVLAMKANASINQINKKRAHRTSAGLFDDMPPSWQQAFCYFAYLPEREQIILPIRFMRQPLFAVRSSFSRLC